MKLTELMRLRPPFMELAPRDFELSIFNFFGSDFIFCITKLAFTNPAKIKQQIGILIINIIFIKEGRYKQSVLVLP